MATRFYFPNSGAAAVSPSFGTGWNDTSGGSPDRIALAKSHKNETAATKTETFNGSTPAFVLIRQFVSEPLADQTISGTVKGQLRGLTSQAAKLGTLAVAIRIVKNDGSDYGTVKDLLTPAASDQAATPPQFSTTLTNRQMQNSAESASISLTSQDAVAGDRLVIEVGVRDTVAHASRTLGLSFGGTTVTDLAEDNTTTTANYPWIEFSGAILIIPIENVKISEQLTARRYGDATPNAENIKISESLTVTRDLEVAVVNEALHIQDGGVDETSFHGVVLLEKNTVRIQDTPQAVLESGPVDLTISVQEDLKISDSGTVGLSFDEFLLVSETLTAEMGSGTPPLTTEIVVTVGRSNF